MKIFLVFGWVAISLATLAPLSSAAETDVDRLLDLLAEKAVVTKEDAAGFRADLAVKKQEDKEKQTEFLVAAGKPLKLSGYTQLRYRQDKSINDTFDIRRARLDAKGDITERFDYRSQIEFGGASGVFLLDATIGYRVNPYIKLIAGQFKIPFSQENLASSPKLETINRSQVVEALAARSSDVIGNQNGRDIGVQASGSFWQKDSVNLFDYGFGLFDGAGINRADTNEQKDFIGRLVFHPFKELSLGGSYYAGRYTLTTAANQKNDRDRIGGEFSYAHNDISLKGEYIKGNDGPTNKDGGYLQAGYFFIPKKLQTVFKYDYYDPSAAADENETRVYTPGINWYFNKLAFLQVNYELKDEVGKERDNNALIGQLTLQF